MQKGSHIMIVFTYDKVANGGILRAFLLTKARDTTIMT